MISFSAQYIPVTAATDDNNHIKTAYYTFIVNYVRSEDNG